MTRRLGLLLTLTILSAGPSLAQAPLVFDGGVVDGASFRPSSAPGGSIAPGSILSIFGAGLASVTAATADFPLPFELGGTRVTLAARPVPLFFVSPNQINGQAPWSTPVGPVELKVQTARGSSAAITVAVRQAAPGLFSQAANGRGPGAILNFVAEGNTPLNTAAATINPNGLVLIYGSGFGPVNPAPADGAPASGIERTAITPVVTVGGRPATVEFSGLAPRYAGLYQINARVPLGTPDGCFVPVTVAFENAVSNTVTIAVSATRGNCHDAATGSPGPLASGPSAMAELSKFTNLLASSTLSSAPPSQDFFTASFGTLPGPFTDGEFPPVGAGCYVSIRRFEATGTVDSGSPYRDEPVDAGTLTLSGPSGGPPRVIPSRGGGQYRTDLGPGGLVAGTWTLTGSGGSRIGPFLSTVNVPAPLFNVTNLGFEGASFSQSRPLPITWSCPDPSGQVALMLTSLGPSNLYGSILCSFACRDGQATVSSEMLSQLPASLEGAATLTINFMPDAAHRGRIKAAGIEYGIFSYRIGVGKFGITLKR